MTQSSFASSSNPKKVGAVLVVGGGIGGMQAALDLADSGFKTYILEEKPAIGGVMAQLDKTFPTNDCSMCIMSPKLVDVGRHPNIELLTYAELQSITGNAGNFHVKIRKKASYVDPEKCTGCGECTEVCPVRLDSEFDMGLAQRHAIYKMYPQAIPNVYTIDKIGIPPCTNACPAHVNAQGYVALIREGKFQESADLIRERNPLPGICGRICTHVCEENCNRNEVDEPVAIRALKRFAIDYERLHGRKIKEKKEKEIESRGNGRKVAIIGSGPAGLTVGYDLARMGYKPTVFEALSQAGGMLRVGVPKYRLPPEILDYDIKIIEEEGVEIRTNTPIGPDLTLNDLYNAGYEAVFIAIGTHKSKKLGIDGEELDGVVHAAGFLHDLGIGKKVDYREKIVAVIGGGNVAIDSVRTALRLGAKTAFVIYRRSRDEIPANREELEECEKEGISFYYLAAPTKILGKDGKVTGIECIRMKLGEPDETGRRQPIPIEGSTFKLDADVVISAVGQAPLLSPLAEVEVELGINREGIVSVPIQNLELEGVYGFTAFLRALSMGQKIEMGKRVLVVGGGNVAIDVARSALRSGGKEIHLVCVESREEMPAFDYEIEEAEQEGIIIHTRRMPKRIIGVGNRAVGVETLQCTSVFDNKGKFNPQIKPNTESVVEADTIIIAIGQEVDYTLLKAADGVLVTKRGLLQVDTMTMQTNIPWVFAAGDAVAGPGLVIEAVAQGHEAAISIDRYLHSEDLYEGRMKKEQIVAPLPKQKVEKKPRVKIPKLEVEKRVTCFEEVELPLTEEEAVKEASRCLSCNFCSLCKQCVDACKAEAIDHDMAEQTIELNIGSVILAPGYDLFDATLKSEYGYGRYQNVLNSLEFERILSASGPYQGHVIRPSDEKEPKKIAWVQCVGSRDNACGHNYCSSVCCTYAIKEAVIAKEHAPKIEPTIFYMDMRTYGKGFEAYYNRAEKEQGIHFVRCRISTVQEDTKTKNLNIKYETEKGELKEETFDMVILSVGFTSREKSKELAKTLGITLNEFGFCETTEFDPIDTTRKGVFVCGAFSGPKDIPETVMEASGAAAKASSLIASERNRLIETKEYPPERDVSGEEPRIGVFICHCGINIGAYVDVPSVVKYAQTLPSVAYAEENLYTCSEDTQRKIVEKIKEHNLNRVIVASCTPRTHEPLFQQTIREAGLNPHLFEMANIRDQCSWVHMKQPQAATEKAKNLVHMAVAKAKLLEPLQTITLEVTQKALVIGGGLAGMIVALTIADQNYEVFLVEKENVLGGNLRNIRWTLEDHDVQPFMRSIIEKVEKHPNIKIYKKAHIENVEGYIGNYTTTIKNESIKMRLQHGVIVVATGAEELKPTEYLYGKDDRVLTQLELENALAEGINLGNKTIVMIQCVGSREEQRPYCSRICCTDAIKNALKIKEKNPTAEVYILYRDMRTYGFRETYYEKARDKGILFIRYLKEQKPKVKKGKKGLEIEVKDLLLNETLLLHADYLVLSPAIIPRPGNITLAQQLKIPLNEDNFFLEAHVKLRPVDFATEGIYLAGLAHSPKSIGETIAQSYGAASRALTIISKDTYKTEAPIAAVNEELCSGCGICETTCPYKAIEMVTKEKDGKKIRVSRVLEAVCKGCGSCTAACPSGAIEQKGFKQEQLISMVDAAAE
ncbi:MAG: FAD-dependent oxidoreductase [Candidatus Thermoplasmatota archaeon]|nr:FAD-dependent oxidoreductase [Candidatus Thermoplasmatota archaeon]